MKGVARAGGGNAGGEAREYTSRLRRVTATEEQTPEKNRAGCLMAGRPVPQTDTGGRVENTKALERLTVKELGKLAP